MIEFSNSCGTYAGTTRRERQRVRQHIKTKHSVGSICTAGGDSPSIRTQADVSIRTEADSPSIRTEAGPPSVCTEAAASDATTPSATSKKSKKCDHGARGPKVHGGGATKTDILNASLTVKPGLGLTSWKFQNEHEFKMFIKNGICHSWDASLLAVIAVYSSTKSFSY